jgi:cytosine/adenosine deaminase-related metal-dependent hydrolase
MITHPRDKDLIAMSIPSLISAHQKHHESYNGRLHVWAAAGTPRGASRPSYLELGDVCSSHGISITMHCAEAPKDLTIYHDTYQCSPMEFIRDTRMCPQPKPLENPAATTSPAKERSHQLVLAHMVNVDCNIDLPLLSSTGTSVAHNPTSNLKLASDVAPVPAMLSLLHQVNVSLGTDGAPCSNHYDMFQEMHLAAILHKGIHHDATLIPAETAWRWPPSTERKL